MRRLFGTVVFIVSRFERMKEEVNIYQESDECFREFESEQRRDEEFSHEKFFNLSTDFLLRISGSLYGRPFKSGYKYLVITCSKMKRKRNIERLMKCVKKVKS